MSTQCYGRLVDDIKAFGLFGNGKNKFHLELRCPNKSAGGTKLCGRCLDRPTELGKYHSTLLHGLVGEALPPWSHIFEGDWYKSNLKKYGEPDQAEMAKAKAAQVAANGGESKTAESKTAETKTVVLTQTTTPTTTVQPKSTAKSTVKRAPKKTQTDVKPHESAHPVKSQAIESAETPMDDKEIVKIIVRPFEHNGHNYFLQAKKNKLYTKGKDGRPHKYHGRWNPETETICIDVPDSDIDI
jgi:hypothetical protein